MIRSPRVAVFADAAAVARSLARRVADAIRAKPTLVLGLPTGRTPLALYAELSRLHEAGEIDFSRVTTFNLDEFYGIPSDHPGSYRSFMRTHFFGRVNIDPARTHLLDGSAADAAAECERYERAIEDAGGIALQILGIGTNGHIGFNEPAPELEARTHRVTLKPETRRSNAALFGGREEDVPREALSMGMGTILQARAVVLLATGAPKAACVERVVNGPITTALPASFLQLHPDAVLMLDEPAAARLTPNS
ncbi:MAG TPA: glucosamine-6-phosphate deaminase [Vicinamibacterales bacterium]|nr:glucosamine-6-phosphate deaminase [Vicinamibacterales bacterium]